MKKFNPNKNIIITLILAIIAVTVLSVTVAKRANNQKASFGQVVVNDTVGFFDKVLYAPVRWFENRVESVENLFVTYQENERLKEKLDSYDEIVQTNKNQERELAALKEELALDATLDNYEKITANVITRSPDTWQDMLIVDKGATDGIEVNMAVMAKKGLIGRVIEVNAASSKIELLSSANQSSNHYPVRISTKDGEAFGVLKGYDKERNALVVEQVTGENNVAKDDVVQTSGLGGNSPAGLRIGTVIDSEVDKFGLDRKVYVQPYADTHDLSVVTIIERTLGDK
ncbi:rod shape-determining protein MreC [Enterococcus saccharolyticus]|uniref:Cell shape-determining protein MreC n=1 Tax=Candidatus Enterococcus willemsii TaxID=1857215 RepID=A0ABQ6YW26_9ENTE|nr:MULTISPECIES: rod shape-determining protein MreC [Enterococcus]KAF1301202.1 rod shape-determining protein MreC [Enterococcus sp. CU12B]MCD5003638.1 rod shape-determining protein MreC [Enterococcus saccharolyticus]